MSHQIDDRWLWLGVGFGLIVAFKGIKYAIEDTVRLTQVKPLGKDQDEELQRQPEDCKIPLEHLDMQDLIPLPAIPVDVLRTLVDSPNPNINKCATDIVLARCVKSPSLIAEVQADAKSSNTDLRRKARLAMRLLGSWSLGGDERNAIPTGMQTGGSTGALNLSPSVVSQDNPFEFDRGVSLPPRMAAQLYDRGGVVEPSNSRNANMWTTAARDGVTGEFESDVQRRQRNREAVVMQAGSEVLDEEDLIDRRL